MSSRLHDALVTLRIRTWCAVFIVVGLLVSQLVSYWREGLLAAEGHFKLLQGILLGAFGWLYGSHGAERAEAQAADERVAKLRVKEGAMTAEEKLVRLERDFQLARLALQAALTVPGAKEKVDDAIRSIEAGHHEH